MDNKEWYALHEKTLEKYFCDYDSAVVLKEMGFDEPCFGSFYTDIDENEKYGVVKKYNGFNYTPISEVDFVPDFIINSEKTYYVSAPLWTQAKHFLLTKKEFVCDTGFEVEDYTAKNKYYITIFYRGQFMFESDYEYGFDEMDKAEVLKMLEIYKKYESKVSK